MKNQFIISETEKERILSLHKEALNEQDKDDSEQESSYSECYKCIEKSVPPNLTVTAKEITKKIVDMVDLGETPTLDSVKDIVWAVSSTITTTFTIPQALMTGKKIYDCIKNGDCDAKDAINTTSS